MVRPIIQDAFFLMQPSQPAKRSDLPIAKDLSDTLKAHIGHCVGLAANMIGERRNIIAFLVGEMPVVMLNPKIVGHSSETYEAEEGCLSLSGVRKAVRYRQIEVEYEDMMMRKRRNAYRNFTAQIIQHEMDHCKGVLI